MTGETPNPLQVLTKALGFDVNTECDCVPCNRERAALAQVEALAEAAQALHDQPDYPTHHHWLALRAALVPFSGEKA